MTTQLVKTEIRSRGSIKGSETKGWKRVLMEEVPKVMINNEECFYRNIIYDNMVNTWMEALKQYNQGKAWCVFKKGTKEYDEVKKIQDKIKRPAEKKTLEKPERATKETASMPVKKAKKTEDKEIMPQKITSEYLSKKLTTEEQTLIKSVPRGRQRADMFMDYTRYVDRHPERVWSDDKTFKFWYENIYN